MTSAPKDPLAQGGIARFAVDFRSGAKTSEQVTRAYLDRIHALDRQLGAYEYVATDEALASARAMDALRASGTDLGPLMGVPISIKDLFSVAKMPLTVGSNIDVSDLVDGREGAFVDALRKAGCVILGKTKMVEFAFGITGVSAPRGTPKNPWDMDTHRLPGGSSSGAGVAVAAGLCALAIGTDTGGSVRVPAALCGVFGLKTTHGLWSTAGAFPLAPGLDSIGLLTQSAVDAAIAHEQITKNLRGGATLRPEGRPMSGLRLGVPDNYFMDGLAPDIENTVNAAIEQLGSAGAAIDTLTIPQAPEREAYFPVVLSSCLIAILGQARFNSNRQLMDPVVAKRTAAGLEALAPDYLALEAHRNASVVSAARLFDGFDAWICPTTTDVAAPLTDLEGPDFGLSMATAMTRNTQPVNYLGLCAVTLPLPRASQSLPVGLQVIGPAGSDTRLLAIASAIEAVLGPGARPEIA